MLNKYGLKLPVTEDEKPRLTNGMLAGMVPMFVNGDDDANHNCDSCFMFIPGSNKCTIVEGAISGPLGTCNYWSANKPGKSTEKDIKPMQMTRETSGYVEVPAGMKIQCGSCMYGDGKGWCKLWDGTVDAGDCCASWDSPKAK